jgi:ribonuclease BN (tRNA processing enzyme)
VIGPFAVDTRLLPHWLPNAGLRLTAGGTTLVYTGDSGPSPHLVELARDADILIAEATWPEHVPVESAEFLSSAAQAGSTAAAANAGRLILTHLHPGVGATESVAAARRAYSGPIAVATER